MTVGSGVILCISWFVFASGLLRFLGVVQLLYYASTVVLTAKPRGVLYLWTADMVALELSDGLEDVALAESPEEDGHDAPQLLSVPLNVASLRRPSPFTSRGVSVPRSYLVQESEKLQQRRLSRISTVSMVSMDSQSSDTLRSRERRSLSKSSTKREDASTVLTDEYDDSEDEDERSVLVSVHRG